MPPEAFEYRRTRFSAVSSEVLSSLPTAAVFYGQMSVCPGIGAHRKELERNLASAVEGIRKSRPRIRGSRRRGISDTFVLATPLCAPARELVQQSPAPVSAIESFVSRAATGRDSRLQLKAFQGFLQV